MNIIKKNNYKSPPFILTNMKYINKNQTYTTILAHVRSIAASSLFIFFYDKMFVEI